MNRITSANPNPKFLETALSYIFIVSDLMEKLQIETWLYLMRINLSWFFFFFLVVLKSA